jgi:hypothetical protein
LRLPFASADRGSSDLEFRPQRLRSISRSRLLTGDPSQST